MSMCPMCAAGLPLSCLNGSCEPTEPEKTEPEFQVETLSPTQLRIESTTDEDDSERRGSRSVRQSGRLSKRNLGDSQSSGRKSAAKLYPLNPNALCEWNGLANCGGGDFPILGCPPGGSEAFQQARHHGPEKNVNNNEEGNVHRICHYCHYRWHAANDKTYDWNAGIYTPHKPRPFTEEELGNQALDYMRYLTKGSRKSRNKKVVED